MKERCPCWKRKIGLATQIANNCRDMKGNASGSTPVNLAMLSAFHLYCLGVTSRCLPVPTVQANKEAEIPPGK